MHLISTSYLKMGFGKPTLYTEKIQNLGSNEISNILLEQKIPSKKREQKYKNIKNMIGGESAKVQRFWNFK